MPENVLMQTGSCTLVRVGSFLEVKDALSFISAGLACDQKVIERIAGDHRFNFQYSLPAWFFNSSRPVKGFPDRYTFTDVKGHQILSTEYYIFWLQCRLLVIPNGVDTYSIGVFPILDDATFSRGFEWRRFPLFVSPVINLVVDPGHILGLNGDERVHLNGYLNFTVSDLEGLFQYTTVGQQADWYAYMRNSAFGQNYLEILNRYNVFNHQNGYYGPASNTTVIYSDRFPTNLGAMMDIVRNNQYLSTMYHRSGFDVTPMAPEPDVAAAQEIDNLFPQFSTVQQSIESYNNMINGHVGAGFTEVQYLDYTAQGLPRHSNFVMRLARNRMYMNPYPVGLAAQGQTAADLEAAWAAVDITGVHTNMRYISRNAQVQPQNQGFLVQSRLTMYPLIYLFGPIHYLGRIPTTVNTVKVTNARIIEHIPYIEASERVVERDVFNRSGEVPKVEAIQPKIVKSPPKFKSNKTSGASKRNVDNSVANNNLTKSEEPEDSPDTIAEEAKMSEVSDSAEVDAQTN